MYYIVFDIGGTSIKYSIMNNDSEFIESDSIETPHLTHPSIAGQSQDNIRL